MEAEVLVRRRGWREFSVQRAYPEIPPLDLAGAQAFERFVRKIPTDGHISARGEHIDLADVLGVQASIAGERAEDVAGPQFVLATGIDHHRFHRCEIQLLAA